MRTRRTNQVIGLSLLATTLGTLPPFLLGVLAPQLKAEFRVSEFYVGVIVSGFFAVSALASVPGGLLVARWGWQRAMAGVGMLAAVAGLLFSGPVGSGANLVFLGVIVAGAANSFTQPAANQALVSFVPYRRRGLAFGIKQTAVPVSTLIAGLSLPLVVAQFGWRAPLYALVPMGLVLSVWVSLFAAKTFRPATEVVHKRGHPRRDGSERHRRAPLLVLCASAGLGAAVATSVATFFVLHAVSAGLSSATAGTLLAAASVGNIITRLFSGWAADRRTGGHLRTVAIMMLIGSVGLLVLSMAAGPAVFAIGAILALGVGWGWNGLLHHGTMVLYRQSAAQVTGVLQTFLFLGAVAGPLGVGLMVEAGSFEATWLAVSAAMVAASLGISLFRRLVRSHGI